MDVPNGTFVQMRESASHMTHICIQMIAIIKQLMTE